jgi:hypothetical protein
MSQLDTTNTFVDGDIVNAAALNNMIDQATALPGLITSQVTANATAGDLVLLVRSGVLKKADVSTFPSGVTSVGMTVDPTSVFHVTVGTPTTTPAIALGLDAQAANKFLAGPVSGAATTPTFRTLNPSDLPVATIDIAANLINWSLGNCFVKQLSGSNANFTFSNPTDGQIIKVLVAQDASHTVTWPSGTSGVFWPGGTAPVMTTGAGRHDIFTIHYLGGHYYGTFVQNFLAV